MPRTLGDSFIHVSQADAHRRGRLRAAGSADAAARRRSQQADRAAHRRADRRRRTLQTGIGAIPDAVLQVPERQARPGHPHRVVLRRRDRAGRAGRHQRRAQDAAPRQDRSPASCWARSALYDFVHDNPIVELHPTEYVNDPFVIAQNDRMVAINSAIEVDLTGQVCADCIGHRLLQRRRRAGGLHPWRGAQQGRQADHRAARRRRKGRYDQQDRADAEARRGRGDHAQRRALTS